MESADPDHPVTRRPEPDQNADAAANRPFIEAWAALLGREAAQAIYPLQRVRIGLAVVNVVVLLVVGVTTPIVGRMPAGPAAIGTVAVVLLVTYLGAMLSLIVVTARRIQTAEREIGGCLHRLGGPEGIVPLMSVGAFRHWAERRRVDTRVVGLAVVAWSRDAVS